MKKLLVTLAVVASVCAIAQTYTTIYNPFTGKLDYVTATLPPSASCTPTTQSGTSYTLVSGDSGCVISFSNAGSITLTVPASLPVGFSCVIIQIGAGVVTPTASGTTLHQRQSLTKTAGQYAVASLVQYTTNVYALTGDLQP